MIKCLTNFTITKWSDAYEDPSTQPQPIERQRYKNYPCTMTALFFNQLKRDSKHKARYTVSDLSISIQGKESEEYTYNYPPKGGLVGNVSDANFWVNFHARLLQDNLIWPPSKGLWDPAVDEKR